MEIDNRLIVSVVTAALAGTVGAGGIGFVKNRGLTEANVQTEEKKDLKFASFEELARDQLAACEARYITCQESLSTCWASK